MSNDQLNKALLTAASRGDLLREARRLLQDVPIVSIQDWIKRVDVECGIEVAVAPVGQGDQWRPV